MFENSEKKESHITIEIKDCQLDTIREMLYFMYTGQLRDYGKESLKQIMLASFKYAMKDLLLESEKALLKYLNVENAPEFLNLAQDVNAKNIKSNSIDVIVTDIDKVDTLALSVLRSELLKDIFDEMAIRKKS